MSLTDRAIRSAKPSAKPQKLFDSRGLYLLISDVPPDLVPVGSRD